MTSDQRHTAPDQWQGVPDQQARLTDQPSVSQGAPVPDIFEGMGQGLAEWRLTSPRGEQTILQLAYFERAHPPVMLDVGPVLDLPRS